MTKRLFIKRSERQNGCYNLAVSFLPNFQIPIFCLTYAEGFLPDLASLMVPRQLHAKALVPSNSAEALQNKPQKLVEQSRFKLCIWPGFFLLRSLDCMLLAGVNVHKLW